MTVGGVRPSIERAAVLVDDPARVGTDRDELPSTAATAPEERRHPRSPGTGRRAHHRVAAGDPVPTACVVLRLRGASAVGTVVA